MGTILLICTSAPTNAHWGLHTTESLGAGSLETAYSLCFEKAQHSLTEFNIMLETSTAEA